MTVAHLLTGAPQPLSGTEYNYWIAFFNVQAEEDKKASKPKGSNNQAENRPTMGQ